MDIDSDMDFPEIGDVGSDVDLSAPMLEDDTIMTSPSSPRRPSYLRGSTTSSVSGQYRMPQHPKYTGFSQTFEAEDHSIIDTNSTDNFSSKGPIPKALETDREESQPYGTKQERLLEAGVVIKFRKRGRVFKGSRDLSYRGTEKNHDKLKTLETQVEELERRLQEFVTDVAVLRAENATLREQNDFLQKIVKKGHQEQPSSGTGKYNILVIGMAGLCATGSVYAIPWARGLFSSPHVDAPNKAVQDLYALDLPGYISQEYTPRPSGFFSWTPLPGLLLIFQSITPTFFLILAIMSFLLAAYLSVRSPITSEKLNAFQSMIWALVIKRIKSLGKSEKKD